MRIVKGQNASVADCFGPTSGRTWCGFGGGWFSGAGWCKNCFFHYIRYVTGSAGSEGGSEHARDSKFETCLVFHGERQCEMREKFEGESREREGINA